jgi:hypothetical protein
VLPALFPSFFTFVLNSGVILFYISVSLVK